MNSYKTTQEQLTSLKCSHPRKWINTAQHLCSWKPQAAAILQVGGLWCRLISPVLWHWVGHTAKRG